MARRKKKEEKKVEGAPAWMVTYSDMVTLLLTFFVMLVAMASFEDVQRVEAVFESIRSALGVTGFDERLLEAHKAESLTEQVRREETLNPVFVKLRQAMSKHLSDELVRMTHQEQEVRIRLDDRVFFKTGSSEMLPSAYGILTDLAGILSLEEGVHVRVEGHTDNSGTEDQNWALASERSLAVVKAMRKIGPIAGERLQSSSFGAFRPASDFGEDDEWNRRIEFVLRADNTSAGGVVEQMMNLGDPNAGP